MVGLQHQASPDPRLTIVLGLVLAVALGGGCRRQSGPKPPPTFSVTGVVRYPDGRPLRGGIIEFLSEANPTLNMSSVIHQDGSFDLTTSFANRNLAGAVEGSCQVLVTLPIAKGALPQILLLRKRYHVRPERNYFVVDAAGDLK